jgi:hypothetical protein
VLPAKVQRSISQLAELKTSTAPPADAIALS